nr:YdcF family protein [Arthrobacter roseus]
MVSALVVLWLLACWFLFFNPEVEEPVPADAIIVLGGASNERLPRGHELYASGYAPVIVLSQTNSPGNARADDACTGQQSEAILCFVPPQMTTRGEARAIARLSADQDWERILVVTSTYHLARAERNIEQCSTVDVVMAPSNPEFGPAEWLGRFVEESVALAASYVRPACETPLLQ